MYKGTAINFARYQPVVTGLAALAALYLASLYSYLLFHSLAELFSITISMAIFMFAWNTRRLLDNDYLLFLGIAYLFIGFLDLLHTLGYAGMNIFPGYGANLSTQLWIVARYMESISLLVAPLFLHRKLKVPVTFFVFSLVCVLALAAIFSWHNFPVCFIEGKGLTPFKKISEYIISMILLSALAILYGKRGDFAVNVFHLLVASILLTIGSELAFTFYVQAYGLSNLIGHYFKILSFYFIYRAIIATGLIHPYELLFKNLKQKERALEEARDKLERRVRERTEELFLANKRLRREIVEREQAGGKLRASEARYQDLYDNAPDMFLSVDAGTGKIVQCNLTTASVLGYAKEEIIGRHISEMYHPDCLGKLKKEILPGLAGTGEADNVELLLRKKDGGGIDVSLSASAVRDAHGNILYSRLIWRDITKVKNAEKEKSESEEQLRLLLNSTVEGIYGITTEGICTFCNPSALLLLGYEKEEDLVGKNIHDILHRATAGGSFKRDIIQEALKGKKCLHPVEDILRRADGASIPVEYWAHPVFKGSYLVGAVVTFFDITGRKRAEDEKKRLEARLRQAQKMEAIGTLAGGIAHDFNNILCAILGYSEMALGNIPSENEVFSDIQRVVEAGNRAKDLVRQILTFSRRSDQELQPLRIQLIVKEALKLLRSSIPTTIEIKQDIDPDCEAVFADSTQIHQIIMNLCTNAYHAMRKTGGVLGVSLKPVELTSEDLENKINLKPGSYVKLEISDTGHGMTRSVLERIFEPYFSTKPKGEGTGLGLALVHGIVMSFHGNIAVYSEPGKGTTFHVYLPVTGEAKEIVKQDAAPLLTGNERILLVDDDEVIAHMNKTMLESLGYRVTALTSSIDTFNAFRKEPEDFDLVVTDMTMPKMTGAELARKILAIRPETPIILCTGFSELINEENAKAIGIRDYIMKPVIQKDLARAVRRALDGE